MKTLPRVPYLDNLAWYFSETPEVNNGTGVGSQVYREWLSTHGFTVPVHNAFLEFGDTTTDEDLTAFVLKWR